MNHIQNQGLILTGSLKNREVLMSGNSLDDLIHILRDMTDCAAFIGNTDMNALSIALLSECLEMTPSEISGKFGVTLADVYAALAYYHHCKPPEIHEEVVQYNRVRELLKNDANGAELVNKTISRYEKAKKPNPVVNSMIGVETEESGYKLIRLDDEQYHSLRVNSLSIHDDYYHIVILTDDKENCIFENYPKMYVALKGLFGESGNYYDHWKGSFTFPFLILKEGDEEFGYLVNICNCKSAMEYSVRKLIHADDEDFDRDLMYQPFDDFPTEEKRRFIDYFVGYLTGYFGSLREGYNDFFFQIVRSNFILFGYKDGVFFEEEYEDEEEFNIALQELEKRREEEIKKGGAG